MMCKLPKKYSLLYTLLFVLLATAEAAQKVGRLSYCTDNDGNYIPILKHEVKFYPENGSRKGGNRHKMLYADRNSLKDLQQFFVCIILTNDPKLNGAHPMFKHGLRYYEVKPNTLIFISLKKDKSLKEEYGKPNLKKGFKEVFFIKIKSEDAYHYIEKRQLENIASYDVENETLKRKEFKAKLALNGLNEKKQKEKVKKILKETIASFQQEVIYWEVIKDIFLAPDVQSGSCIKLHITNKKSPLWVKIQEGKKVIVKENKDKVDISGLRKAYNLKNRRALFREFQKFFQKQKWQFDLKVNEKEAKKYEDKFVAKGSYSQHHNSKLLKRLFAFLGIASLTGSPITYFKLKKTPPPAPKPKKERSKICRKGKPCF